MQNKIGSRIGFHHPQSRPASLFLFALATAFCLLPVPRAGATLVAEDFAYPTGSFGNAATNIYNGGAGWLGSWPNAGTGNLEVVGNFHLSYNTNLFNNGYNITQTTGAGLVYSKSPLSSTDYRGTYRNSTPLNGVVWFSALMMVSNGIPQVYLGFNSMNTAVGYDVSSAYEVGLSGTSLGWSYGGSGTTLGSFHSVSGDTGLATNVVHLILGCLTFNGTNATELQLWADPPSLGNLNTNGGDFQVATYNIGTNLFNIEVGGMADSAGNNFAVLGALRLSDGGGSPAQAYTDVTGVTNQFISPTGGLIWQGGAGATAGLWDETSTNWRVAGGPTNGVIYTDGYPVIFANGASVFAVNVTKAVYPASVALTGGGTNIWTFQGAGMIAGTGPFFDSFGGVVSIGLSNSYSGGTFLVASNGGNNAVSLTVTHDGGLGGGNVTVSNGAVLTLTGGISNNYVANTAALILVGTPTVNLNYTGADTIGGLSFNGGTTFASAGTWGAPGSAAANISGLFTGTGLLVVGKAATSAINFLNSIGINGGNSSTDTNPSYLGVGLVRGGSAGFYANTGIPCIVGGYYLSQTISSAESLASYSPNALLAVEGQDEPGNFLVHYPASGPGNITNGPENLFPAGYTQLSSSSTGVISGMGTATNNCAVALQAANANGIGSAVLTLTVGTTTFPVITSPAGAAAIANTPFTYQITATNGPITRYNATFLPPGLVVNTNTGVISGTPTWTNAGTWAVTLNVANTNGIGQATVLITMNANPALPVITSPAAVVLPLNTAGSYTITASNNPTTYSAFPSWLPVAQHQRDLYAAVKADPLLQNYPVFDASAVGSESDNVGMQFLVIPTNSVSAGSGCIMPPGTVYADYANCHNYLEGSAFSLVDNVCWDASVLTSTDPNPNGVEGLYSDYGKTWAGHYPGYSDAGLLALPRVTTETGWETGNTYGPVGFTYTNGLGGNTAFMAVNPSHLGSTNNNITGWVGSQFTVGNSNIVVNQLGRWVVAGNTQTHTVQIVRVSDTNTVASATVVTAGQTVGQFSYTSITPVTLSNNTAYFLVSHEISGGDVWWNYYSDVAATNSGIINHSIRNLDQYGDYAYDSHSVTEDQQGKLLLNLYLSEFARGWSAMCVYDESDAYSTFGFYYYSGGAPKLAVTYLHNFTTILADTNSIAPGRLDYSISNEPAQVHDLLLQKSNGTFCLVVWDDRPVGEGMDNVTVNFAGTRAMVNVYDPILGTAVQQTFNSTNAVGLTLSDHPVILAISPTNYPPGISQQPFSQTNYVGQNAQFTVVANGSPMPAYQWQVCSNGSYFNLSDGGNIAGSATATLALGNVAAANATNYVVVVTNAFGAVTSSVVTLTVLPPPRLGSVGINGSQLIFTLASVAGQGYQVAYKTNLTDLNWMPLVGTIVGTGGLLNVTNNIMSGQRFFRVQIMP